MVVRAIVIDEMPLVRNGIAAAIATRCGWLVWDFGAVAADAVRLLDCGRANMVVLGVADTNDAVAAIRIMAAKAPHVGIVCLVPADMPTATQRLMQAGAKGCISRHATNAELLRCLELVVVGGDYISPTMAASLLCQLFADRQHQRTKSETRALTLRESEILKLVGRGHGNKTIANELSMSEKTIKRSITFIMHKLQLRTRLEIALYVRDKSIAAPNASTAPQQTGG